MPARLLFQHLTPYARRYALGFGCLALASLCALAIPWTLKRALTYALVCVAIVTGFYVIFDIVFLVPLPEMPF